MHRFARAVFAVALGQAIVVPLLVVAQRRAALTVGVTTAARNHESRQTADSGRRRLTRPWPDNDSSAKKLSLNHSSACNDCVPPASYIPAFGATAGTAVGAVIGWLVYLARMSPPAP